MTTIKLETFVPASIETCFDMARDIGLHIKAAKGHNQKAVDGVRTGLIGLGETVTWEGDYLFLTRQMTSRIVQFDRPNMFVDEMQQGAFGHWRHVHRFSSVAGGTKIYDDVDFASPFGVLGVVTDKLFMKGYMRRILIEHNEYIRHVARTWTSTQNLPENPHS